jgi:hypothetical protein
MIYFPQKSNSDIMEQSEMEMLLHHESKDFYNYLHRLKMINGNTNVLVLPNKQHFYYDAQEIQQFNTIINVKKLNHIKKLDDFLYSLYCVLKKDTYFCGCFVNNKNIKNFNIKLRVYKLFEALILLLDVNRPKHLSEKDVKSLLNAHQFKIMNMKEIRGITYFYAKKI